MAFENDPFSLDVRDGVIEDAEKYGMEVVFADLGYVLAAGQLALAGTGSDLLADPQVGRLFLGG